jgi:antitoxin component YwqK of YwqJK toxin-antitoxin module
MKITLKMLAEKKACDEAIELFIKNFSSQGSPDHTEILSRLHEKKLSIYAEWLLQKFKLDGVVKWYYESGKIWYTIHFAKGNRK